MDRRRFLKSSLMTWGASAIPPAVTASRPAARPSEKARPQYIRELIPSFEIPPYRGQTYEDKVPDTLDLAERAKLALNGVTSLADPEADYEIFWLSDFTRNPPIMLHDFNDWVQNQEGIMEVVPLLRNVTGDNLNDDVDPAWMKSILKSIGPDGLTYMPLNGRPWARLNSSGVEPVWKADGTKTNFNDPSVTQFTSAAMSHRSIGTMTVYYLRDRNPMWKAAIEKMIQGLYALAIEREDFCFFPAGCFEPGAKSDPGAEVPIGSGWGVTWNSRLIQPLAQYFKVTGYEPARDLARKLANYTRYRGEIFDPQGPWLLDPEIRKTPRFRREYNVTGLTLGGHSHGHGIGLLSVLEYAVAVEDKDLLAFCKASFDWCINPGHGFGVSKLVGWFPEWYVPKFPFCEGCTMGDFLGIAVKLSEAGVGDYWDDIDRWVRNNFAEMQLTSTDWVYKMAERWPHARVEYNETSDHVPEKNIGVWAGWSGSNEWVGHTGVQHCCTGNAPRGLYYVWEHQVDHDGDELQVNLLLNHASRWADIYSYIPYEGRVDLKIKESCRSLRVRAPEWVTTGSTEIVCKLNGAARPLHWKGRYVDIGAAKPGDGVVLTFPVSERTARERIGVLTHTLVLKGSTVVSIDAPGEDGPLYQGREKYRKGKVQWLRSKRFVPENQIKW